MIKWEKKAHTNLQKFAKDKHGKPNDQLLYKKGVNQLP